MTGSPAEVGSTANHYQILARLAVGGMAEIFLARGVSTGGVERYCVLKRILRDRASDLHFVRMFLDEARLAAQLNHPNVAQVFDIGKLADSYFFTMEYVHGETVRAVLQRARSLRRELPLGVVLTVIAGTAAGLHHAHERLGLDGRPLGIVHRDVSPSNLMASYEGGVKVVDFGVAKAADRMSETRSGTVKGKISYLSPEQCRGAHVDRRTDLFALGIVTWEMLTGERLYRRASDFDNMSAIVNEPTPPPSSRRRSLPPELDALVLRMLAKRPDERFQTGEEVIEALEQAATSTGSMISTSGLGRFLREMFGQRPEPWLELDIQHDAPEGVTVTSEPIPSELAIPVADSVDLQLAGIPDLRAQGDGVPQPISGASSGPSSGPLSGPSSSPSPLTSQMRPSRPKPVEASAPVELALPLPPPPTQTSGPVRMSAAPGELPLPAPPATMPEVLPNRAYAVSTPSAPSLTPNPDARVRRSGPQVPLEGPGSGRHSVPGSGRHSVPGSGRHSVQPASSPPAPPASVEEPERAARGWPMIAVIFAAMVIGSLTVLLVMKTGGGTASPDAAVARTASPEPTGPVAGPTVTPIDAAAAPDEVPVAVATDFVAIDAEIDAPAAAPDAAAAPAEPAKTPLESAMDDRRYEDAVVICAKRVTSDIAAACTLAACHARTEAKARAWFLRVPASGRSRLIGLCRSLGIDPVTHRPQAPPPPKTDAGVDDRCEKNPMACQH